jgi:hypothetical protein
MITRSRQALADRKSPYTRHTAEAAISHLERILSAEGADSIFSRTYWRSRVEQIGATPELAPGQRARLAKLIECLRPSLVGKV